MSYSDPDIFGVIVIFYVAIAYIGIFYVVMAYISMAYTLSLRSELLNDVRRA